MKKWLIIVGLALALALGYFLNERWRPGPATLLARGRAAFDQGNYPAARAFFLRVRAATPGHSGARNEAALFYATSFLREKKYASAEAEFRKFLAEYPATFWSPEAYFDLAECETALGRPAAADRLYREIGARFPTTSWAEYARDKVKK